MGIGHLSRYRRHFMIVAFLMFAGGALIRWHHKRTLASIERRQTPQGDAVSPGWVDDCRGYACPLLGASRTSCDEVCQAAVADGIPRIEPERIARACKADCESKGEKRSECRITCFRKEAASMVSR